ncbi:hypothetical protein CONCODRAFT_16247 [Conidiobolus coronatus NRRL 28638]|uniref:Homologous recombination OB-fold protein OB-fold domain-containing protein n=1 Tax=Conidiobolus coronatus (strain ATCC 28846 / CBS 209.66 / NRRL 28638) TaxID=796925 RepID=A0A137PBJ6_CONC2|nr:hypothetical protein CONCODRAFT_16247 [Conidiobolus coronatus NRRL 28638]|eukprot:KXN72326.1 hypothetical protein CONCODRAFT_16247 [Conidiobolus coronatus NRRL 28638]
MGDISAGLDLNSRLNPIQNTNNILDTIASEPTVSSPINEDDLEEYLKTDILELSQIAMKRMSTGLGLNSNLNYIQNNDSMYDDASSSSPTYSFQASSPINEDDLEDYLKTDILELSQIINRHISQDLNLSKKFNDTQVSNIRYESRTTSTSSHGFQVPHPVNQADLDDDLERLMDGLNGSSKESRHDDSTVEPSIIASSDNNVPKPIFVSQAISLSQKPRLRKSVYPLEVSEVELPRFNSELGRDTSLIASNIASKSRASDSTGKVLKLQIENQQNRSSQKPSAISQELDKELPEPGVEPDVSNITEISASASKVNAEHGMNITIESELERSKITLDKQMSRVQQDNELLNMLEEELQKYYNDLELAISENAFAPLYKTNVTRITKKVVQSGIDKRLNKSTQFKRKSQSGAHPDVMRNHISISKESELDRNSKRSKIATIVTNTYKSNLNSAKSTENEVSRSLKDINKDNLNSIPISDQLSKSSLKYLSSDQPSSSVTSNLSKTTSTVQSVQLKNAIQKPSSANIQIEKDRQISSVSNCKRFPNSPYSVLGFENDFSMLNLDNDDIFEDLRSSRQFKSLQKAKSSISKDANINNDFPKSIQSDNGDRIDTATPPIRPQNEASKSSINSIPKQSSKDILNQLNNNSAFEHTETISQLEQVIKSTDLTCDKTKNISENREKFDEISMQMKLAEIEKAQMEEYHLLKRSGWSDFLLYYGQGENKELGIYIQSNTIEQIHAGVYKELVIPYLAIIVKNINCSESGIGIEFFDPTNRIESSVSLSLIEEYQNYCKPGMVWVLEKPTVCKPRKGDFQLVILSTNLVQVFLAKKKSDGKLRDPIYIRSFNNLSQNTQRNTQSQTIILQDTSEIVLSDISEAIEDQQHNERDLFKDDGGFDHLLSVMAMDL